MTYPKSPRGSAVVGSVTDLDPVEAGAVIYLRAWFGGHEQQTRMYQDFAGALGPDAGRQVTQNFGTLCDLCARHGRRPIMRHGLTCRCLGADEACFANFIGYATEGEREDAFLLAATMVRPDLAHTLIGLAQDFGLAVLRLTHACGRLPEQALAPQQHPKTLH